MGLGKTATTLAHLVERPGPHLVVCPLSVVHNWETEANRFTPSLAVTVHHGAQRHGATTNGHGGGEGEPASVLAASDLVVTTYGLLGRDLDVLADVAWATVVLDEAQFVKNPATIGRAVRKLHAGQRIALTGTPVENVCRSCGRSSTGSIRACSAREKFRHRYSKPIERGDDGVVAEEGLRLKALTRPFVAAPRPIASSGPNCPTRSNRSPGPGSPASRPCSTRRSSTSCSNRPTSTKG